jgi:GTPase Era involved in 16S rRNA processing
MIFKAEIRNIQSMKEGTKIMLYLDDRDNQLEEVIQLHRLKNEPVLFGIKQDVEKSEALAELISGEQRKKAFALIKDIGNDLGYTLEEAKEYMKKAYCEDTENENFSLSDTTKENATNFIKYMLEFAFQNGVNLKEKPQDYLNDIRFLVEQSIKNRKCIICGAEGADIHHLNGSTAGASGGRKNMDNDKSNRVGLCRVHHSEYHAIGHDTFCEKYHLELPDGRTHN